MAEELLGIVKEDPTFAPNMEPKGFFGLQIMRVVTKFSRWSSYAGSYHVRRNDHGSYSIWASMRWSEYSMYSQLRSTLLGSGQSDEAPRWVGQSRVGDSAMVGAAKRSTRAMQRPSRPHSMVLKVRRRNWFRSVYRKQGWQSVEWTWWEESLVEKGYTYSSLENNEAPDLNAKLNPGLTIPNHLSLSCCVCWFSTNSLDKFAAILN